MTSSSLVSILTPTYNHQQFIAECIESVITQSHANWEQIIIDDGSTDATWEIAEEYSKKDRRIRCLRQLNKGPGRLEETYNSALAQSRGEYIAILEGDDRWLPNKLSIQLQGLSEQIVFSYSAFFHEIEGTLHQGPMPPFHGNLSMRQFLPIVLMQRSFMIAVTQLIRKDALFSIGGFHQDGSPAAVDMATLLRLARLPGAVRYIQQPLGIWRHHDDQSTNVRAIELARFNCHLAVQCFEGLSVAEQDASGICAADIVACRRPHIADAYFTVLRRKLRRREKSGMVPIIAGMWANGNLKRKIQAIYAMGGFAFGYDFERILRLAGKLYNPDKPSQ